MGKTSRSKVFLGFLLFAKAEGVDFQSIFEINFYKKSCTFISIDERNESEFSAFSYDPLDAKLPYLERKRVCVKTGLPVRLHPSRKNNQSWTKEKLFLKKEVEVENAQELIPLSKQIKKKDTTGSLKNKYSLRKRNNQIDFVDFFNSTSQSFDKNESNQKKKGFYKKLTYKEKKEIVLLFQSGMRQCQIAKKYKLSPATVYYFLTTIGDHVAQKNKSIFEKSFLDSRKNSTASIFYCP
jgi:hypothetical protein